MREAILVIDFTKDFVADDGKLTCGKPAQDIDKMIRKLVTVNYNVGNDVIVLNDIHFEGDTDHPESKLFPPHNIEGTDGRELYGETAEAIKKIEKFHQTSQTPSTLFKFDKTRYSAFANTHLDGVLKSRKVTTLHLVGVCTDICILHTAVDAYNLGYNVVIHKDAVASFNQVGHEWALAHFENTLGFKVVEGL